MSNTTRFELENNTFVFRHKLNCTELDIERNALNEALKDDLGIVYSASTADNKILQSIKKQCEEADKNVFL